ncbi:MAG: hypothetical protein SFV54_27825 [Bryobacteraceae bacterium]|nr:hypothetical protein [Bryobacteraceae bacterium]
MHLESGQVEDSEFDLTPTVAEGERICGLFDEWLKGQPPEFQERVPFLKRGDLELSWSAASGGVAFASFHSEGAPLSMSLLLSGLDSEADRGLLIGMAETGLGPEVAAELDAPQRPLLATVLFPGAPEAVPTLQLLSTALASVFFRKVFEPR